MTELIPLANDSQIKNPAVRALLDERAGLYEKLTAARRLLKEKQQLADDPDLPMTASRRAEVERAKAEKLQDTIAAAQPRFEQINRELADLGYVVHDNPRR